MNRTTLYAACTLALTPALQAQTEYTEDGSPTALEEEIRWLLNRGRYDSAAENTERATGYTDIPASSGPLAPHAAIIRSARRHAEDMAVLNLPQHDTLDDSSYYDSTTHPYFADRMEVEGYTSWALTGENIAAAHILTPAEIYEGWWNSWNHRVNMYDAAFSEIGLGHFFEADSDYWNYYNMDLGSRWGNSFFTGTVFHDANTDGVYNQGEGLGGIEVTIAVNGDTTTSSYDVSEPVGSFAVSIDDVPLNSKALIKLKNTTGGPLTCSIPLSYSDSASVSLAAGELVALGTFTRTNGVSTFGFRNLAPVQPSSVSSIGDGDFTLTWDSQAFLEYQVEWSANLIDWTPMSGVFSNGTGSSMSCMDSVSGNSQRFYRLKARWDE